MITQDSSSPARRHPLPLLHALLWSAILCVSGCGKKEDGPKAGSGGGSGSEPSGAAASSAAPAVVEVEEVPLGHPASVAEAAERIDFTTFPIMESALEERQRSLANLSCRVSADVKTAYEFQKKHLMAKKWKELPGGTSVTEQYASGTFTRAGFHVSVMVSPHSEAGKVDVMMHNHGNVALAKLPRPSGMKAVYEGPITAIYTTETPVPDTVAECEKLLLADGWQPYGMEGDMRCYKKNAVMVKAMVSVAPAQGNKTSISYFCEQMSADVPIMPGAEGFRYVDSNCRFDFDTAEPEDAVAAFYRKALTDLGWQATMDKSIEINGKNIVIFRNAPMDLMELQMKEGPGKLRVSINYQTAAQVKEMDRRLDAQAEAHKAKMKAEAAKPTVKVDLPANATVVSETPHEIKFTMEAGGARALAQTWSDKFQETGWRLERGGYEGGKGMWAFHREAQKLAFVYTDEGGAPAEVTVTSTGVPLERNSGQ